jgi:endonuclease/exonuclease/phosphatase family metal-dependent hydrolase
MPASHQPYISRLFPVSPNATQLPLTAAFKRCLPAIALLCLPLLTPPALAEKTDQNANHSSAEPSLRLISYNIRCGYCEPVGSPHHWDTRKFLLSHQLKLLQPDLIALQEAEHFQITELSRLLPEYRWYGVGRDDGKQQGEATAVLYRHSKLALLQAQTLWLSPTPQQVSNGWGAQLNRTLTLTRFRQLAAITSDTGTAHKEPEFFLLNTHFDHQSDESRRQSAALILRQAAQLPASLPLLLAGDLNLTSQHPAYQLLNSQLQDAAASQPKDQHNLSTFNGFGQDYAKGVGKIDFVFVRGPLRVNQHWIEQRRDQGLFPSDHDPVIVDFQLTQP